LESDSEELVMVVLRDAISKYEVQLMRPLELKPLLNKKLNECSGGELQRVAIARCLSQDADLFLLDEPSAYLDIEQRLNFGKIVRDIADMRGCSILVVDHDLLFIDNVSDRLLVFDGIPAKEGIVNGPFDMVDGMNHFLRELKITLRRDIDTKRPRINKEGSRLDSEQRETGKLYYS